MIFNPCFVIPIYNHHQTIAGVIDAISGLEMPCIIVDDGSDPVTQETLAEVRAAYPFVRVVRLEKNQGKGAAVMAGIREAYRLDYTHAIQIDSDGQHDPTDLPVFIETAKANPAALISGQPVYDDSIPKKRLYGRYITHFWVWVETLSLDIKDTMCGYRVYPVRKSHELINSTRPGKRMDFDIEIMVRLYWSKTPVIFIPTKVRYHETGISHFRLYRDNAIISWMHTRLVAGMLCRSPLLLWRKLVDRGKKQAHWSTAKERGSYWAISFTLLLYRCAGLWALNAVLYPIVIYFFITGVSSRRASILFLRRVYEYDTSVCYFQSRPGLLTSFSHFMQFAHAIRDKVLSWFGRITKKQLIFKDSKRFSKVVQSRRGALIIGSHLGDLEGCRALAQGVEGFKLNVLVLTRHAGKINKLFKVINPAFDLELIQVTDIGPDTIIILKEKIKNGEFVVILGDRTSATSFGRVNYIEFLGKEAPFSQGPFIMAALLECPVYLMFCFRNNGAYELHFEHFLDELDLPKTQRQQALQEVMARFAKRLEYYAVRYPLQWFNYFDFWQKDDPCYLEKH